MYSLALIIFVVSEKKAFEYFQVSVFFADWKSKMAAIAGHRLTLDRYEIQNGGYGRT
jgi:hypothetical protein